MKRTSCLVGIVVALLVALGALVAPPASAVDETAPYGNDATAKIADRLKGKSRVGWLATTLDMGGYHGKRHAEIVRIPEGHGARWVGIIHVPAGKQAKARKALSGVWFAQSGRRFVVPLKSKYNTDGSKRVVQKRAAKWSAKRMGSGWTVRQP